MCSKWPCRGFLLLLIWLKVKGQASKLWGYKIPVLGPARFQYPQSGAIWHFSLPEVVNKPVVQSAAQNSKPVA